MIILVDTPTDATSDPDYVQDIIEVYLNTEMQGLFSCIYRTTMGE